MVDSLVHLAFLEGGTDLVHNLFGLTGGFFVGGFLVTKEKGLYITDPV